MGDFLKSERGVPLSSSKQCLLGALLLISGLLIAGCADKKKKAATDPTPSVTTTKAVTKDVPIYLNAIGYTTAYESVEIMSQVDGQLMEIHFEQGTEVKKGDLLFTIDTAPYKAALEQARGVLKENLAALKINQLAVDRSRPLVPQNLISQQEFDALKAAVDESIGLVEESRGLVREAEINLGYCSIHAPIAGLIDIYLVNAGNIILASEETILTTIRRLDPIYVDFVLTERHLPELQQAIKAASPKPLELDVSLMVKDAVKHTAKLEVLGNTVQRNTGVLRMRGIMENKDQAFWPGASVNVSIVLRTEKDAVVVPEECVQLSQKGYQLFVLKSDSTVELRTIKLGERIGDDVVVESGVKPGEVIIVTGQIMLKKGSKVKVVKPPKESVDTRKASSDSSSSSGSSTQ